MYKLLKSELGQCQHERILCLHKSMPELHSVAFGSNSLVNLEANLNTLAQSNQPEEIVLKYFDAPKIRELRKFVE